MRGDGRAGDVRARIADLILGDELPEVVVGRYTLRPAQARALTAVRRAFAEFGGALLADPPGTGKTVVALAAAASFQRVLVVAPAALRAQWLAAATHADVAVTFTSFESLSRGRTVSGAELVIVDEAHHARTPSTRRYARLAACCAHSTVLLLSATPVVNRREDRDALLGLFLGSRVQRLDPSALGRCIVRDGAIPATRPSVRRLPRLHAAADVPGVAEALDRLPPALPVLEGTAAGALIVMSLAMAWRSSLAALDGALRRRVQRGEVFADLLRAGRLPSRSAIRLWATDGETTQLAFPGLDAAGEGRVGPETLSDAERTLAAHLQAVRALRTLIRPHVAADTRARADALRGLADAHPDDRIVVLGHQAETIRSLYAALRSQPGVVALTGSRVQAASGRWSRAEVLRAVGPRAGLRRSDDPRAVAMLLATDVVAEGVEMQGVRLIVHADLPWTPARIEQRLGRVTRVGSLAREVLETAFVAPRGAKRFVQLAARLARKSRARRESVRDGEARAALESLLGGWRAPTSSRAHRLAAVGAPCTGFIAVVQGDDGPQLLCGTERDGHWRVSASPRRTRRLCELASGPAAEVAADQLRRTLRAIRRAMRRRRALALVEDPCGGGVGVIARLRSRFDRILERTPIAERTGRAARHEELLSMLRRRSGVALETRLGALLVEAHDDPGLEAGVAALLEGRTSDACRQDFVASRPHPRAGRTTVAALLLLSAAPPTPAAPAPARSSASP